MRDPKAFRTYLKRPMITSKHDYIVIHTSLNTNKWNQDGSQSNILEIINLQDGQLYMGKTYEQTSRIY